MNGKFIYAILFLLFFSAISDKAGETDNLDCLTDTSPNYINDIYNSLIPQDSLPSYEAFKKGMTGYINILNQITVENEQYLTLIDFSLPSVDKRLWVIDLSNRRICFNTWVAHGVNSGDNMATSFSNRPKSNMSSLGFYLTGKPYVGKHGLSLRLDGLEKGVNDNVRKRSVVIHSADYVSMGFIKKHNRLGRSFGCPAIPVEYNGPIINAIKNKSVLFVYYPDNEYNIKSELLNSKNVLMVSEL